PGSVPAGGAPAVGAAGESVAWATPPIALSCAGLGVFPGPRRPRVVWAGISSGLRESGVLASTLAPPPAPGPRAPRAGARGRIRGGVRPLDRFEDRPLSQPPALDRIDLRAARSSA